MFQKVNQKFILCFILTHVIKEHEDVLREVQKKYCKFNFKDFFKKYGRLIMQSKYADCRNEKSRFVKEQEAKGLLSNLGIKTPLSKIPLLYVLFTCA